MHKSLIHRVSHHAFPSILPSYTTVNCLKPRLESIRHQTVLSQVIMEDFNGEKRFKLPPPVPKRLAPKINPAIFQRERTDDPMPLWRVLQFLKPHGKEEDYICTWIELNLNRQKKNYVPVSGKAVLRLGVLPPEEGKEDTEKILVFATGKAAEEATAAGATMVGGTELIKRIQEGDVEWLQGFTKALATPEMYREATKVARVIGPMGLMPNVKKGTVTEKVGPMVATLRSESKVAFEEKEGIITTEIAKLGWERDDISANIACLLEGIIKANTNNRRYMIIGAVRLGLRNGPRYKISLKRFGKLLTSIKIRNK